MFVVLVWMDVWVFIGFMVKSLFVDDLVVEKGRFEGEIFVVNVVFSVRNFFWLLIICVCVFVVMVCLGLIFFWFLIVNDWIMFGFFKSCLVGVVVCKLFDIGFEGG